MPSVQIKSGCNEASLRAKVTRADGSIEDLGIIAYNHRNPFKVARWEYETFGKVTEETAMRCAKAAAPFAAAAGGALLGLGYFLVKR